MLRLFWCPQYQYQWNTGSVQEDLNNLLAGTYNLTIQDAHGCTINQSYTVNQPPQSIIATQTHQNVSCFGGNNGSINLTVSGTGQPFTYLWNSGQTTQDIANLVPGIYTVTITDHVGCTWRWTYRRLHVQAHLITEKGL